MEADPPSPQQLTAETENLHLEEQPEEDSWFDDDSQQEDKEDEEQEIANSEKLSILVGESEQSPLLKIPNQGEVSSHRFKEWMSFDHQVDHNYLILLIVLSNHRMIDLKQISGLKEGYIDLVSKHRKMVVKTTSETAAGEAIERISDFLDKLSVIKLDLHGEVACKFADFDQLKRYLRSEGVVLFGNSPKQRRELFLGGVMRPSQLRIYHQRVRCFKVVLAYLRALRDTRSYKLIIGAVLSLPCTQKALLEFNQIKFAQVLRRNRTSQLRVSLATLSRKQFTANDYQDVLMKQLHSCCALAFCFLPSQKYLQKPKVDGVAFKIITEKAINRSYLYVIAGKEEWVVKEKEIRAEIAKLQKVVGVRVFYHIFPHLGSFPFSRERYYYSKYPNNRPYSLSVSARTKQGFDFNWNAFMDRLVQLCRGEEGECTMIE